MHHINKTQGTKHMIISLDAEKMLDVLERLGNTKHLIQYEFKWKENVNIPLQPGTR